MPSSPHLLDLAPLFDELNERHFDGFLEKPQMVWNNRLRSSAGRFIPGSRKWILQAPPRIEIASYLAAHPDVHAMVRDTMGHEMIHYWLWVRRQPYGHTPEFYAKMRQMGVSRYNPIPRYRPYKWMYRCGSCMTAFPARRRFSNPFACAKCCKQYTGGRYDSRFKLVFEGPYVVENETV